LTPQQAETICRRLWKAPASCFRQQRRKNKSVIIVGDFTHAGYDVQALPWSNAEEQPETLLIDVRKGRAIDNVAVSSLSAERSYFTGSADWNIKIKIAAYGDRNVSSLPVSLFVNGENTANGFIE
jgi:hypothetical protein